MRLFALAAIALFIYPHPVLAQNQPPSHWGVVGGFAPNWETTDSFEPLTKLVFEESAVSLLKGSEFRIGILRGRRLSGDWGVSFIRKNIADSDPTVVQEGRGCQGQSGPGGALVLSCEVFYNRLTPAALRISGLEFHKYVAFLTVRERAQIGLNFAGGLGWGQGSFRTETFTTTFDCTFPPGQQPDFMQEDPCTGATKGPEVTTPTGTGSEPFTYIMTYSRNRIPIGKIEIAGTVILTPQVKLRIGGGLNYPGRTTFGVTGLYFFGRDN
jgi:hypothetical protein